MYITMEDTHVSDLPLDPGIREAVEVLDRHHVETFESCEGGIGHTYPDPTVRFHGESYEGLRALAAALQAGLPVHELNRVWRVQDGEVTGPWWELVFRKEPATIQQLPSDYNRAQCSQSG